MLRNVVEGRGLPEAKQGRVGVSGGAMWKTLRRLRQYSSILSNSVKD
jgi:hypothetical protein